MTVTLPTPPTKSRKKRQRGFIDTAILLTAVVTGLAIRFRLWGTAIVNSSSMSPTIQVGDDLVVDHRAGLHHSYRRGDIIIFRQPDSWDGDEGLLTKRVIGLPGEVLMIKRGLVYINGQMLHERYVKDPPAPRDYYVPRTIPRNQYFVMGDNRDESDDSRFNGPVPDNDVWGRVVYRISPLNRAGRIPTAVY